MKQIGLIQHSEAAFLAAYNPRAYTPVAVTVDIAALSIRAGRLVVLLARRANPPFAGAWCLPGGFLVPDPDGSFPSLEQAASRRLVIETGISPDELVDVRLEQLASFGTPGRDPRMAVISVAYLAFGPHWPEPVAGRGVLEAAWVPVEEALGLELAFDHAEILAVALERVRAKFEYTSLATSFLDPTFTIAQLQHIYEIVWGVKLLASGFRRKVRGSAFVVAVQGNGQRQGTRGGRLPQLYRAGDGSQLFPPIRRRGVETAS